MPNLEPLDEYLGGRFSSAQDSAWYRNRLLVWVPLQNGSGNAEPLIVKALNTVVSVQEAPFLEAYERVFTPLRDFVCVLSLQGESSDQTRIFDTLRKFSDENNAVYYPNVVSGQGSDALAKGTYFGLAQCTPRDGEIPRGKLTLQYHDPTRAHPLCWEPTYGVGPDVAIGLFQGQDRFIFSLQDTRQAAIPMGLKALDGDTHAPTAKYWMNDKLMALLPRSVDAPRARLMTALLDSDGIATERQAQHNPETTPNILSLIRNDPSTIKAVDLVIDADREEFNVDVSDQITTDQRGTATASLSIVPNTAYARLRHTPGTAQRSYFSILGVLLPSPIAQNDAAEVCINLTRSGHLTGHSLDDLDSAMVLRPRSRRFRALNIDEALFATRAGLIERTDMNRRSGFADIGSDHRICLMQGRVKLPFSISNKIHQQTSMGMLESLHQNDRVYLMVPRDSGGTLGFFGCPLVHGLQTEQTSGPRDAKIHERPGSRAVDVAYRRDTGTQSTTGLCLDWLDEAIRIAGPDAHKFISGGIEGYAEYWSTWSQRLPPAFGARQTLKLYHDNESDPYMLALNETYNGRDYLTYIQNSGCVRIGPLICQYHHG